MSRREWTVNATLSFKSPPPNISAASWAICETDSGGLLWGKADDEARDIASITKMMTCYVTHRYVTLGILDWDTEVEVSRYASSIGGTSANLREGDLLTVKDLMYGMMLPSGNDAALTLAELIGEITHDGSGTSSNYANTFVGEMNRFARHMGLTHTHYLNPHGLRAGNKSTCRDIARLASYLMSEEEIREIVNTKTYKCTLENYEFDRQVRWNNTNKLLGKGFSGVKTGQTQAAGP